MILAVRARALVRELDDEAVLLDLDSEMYYGLNASAAWIWNRLSAAGALPLETLVAELVEEFDVDRAAAERDVTEFAAALRANRLADARS